METVERISQANDIVIDILCKSGALIEDVWQRVIPDQPGVINDRTECVEEDLSLRGDEFIKLFLEKKAVVASIVIVVFLFQPNLVGLFPLILAAHSH